MMPITYQSVPCSTRYAEGNDEWTAKRGTRAERFGARRAASADDATQDRAGSGTAGTHRVGLCRWHGQQDSCGETAGHPANGFEVAGAVRDPSPGRTARCTTTRRTEDD